MKKVQMSVDITDDLKREINNKINTDVYEIASQLKINPTRLYEYFIWRKSTIPLNILMKISEKFNISKERLHKNIVIYKQRHAPATNSIRNPKIPIEISPYMTSIVSHLFFDGSVPRDGKGTYYNQKNEKIMDDFIKKLNSVFGDVSYSLKIDHKGVLKCRMPRLIGEICRNVYGITTSFGTFDARVPKKIFKMDDDHKQAFVLSAIIDEGSITYDGDIMFGVSNKWMCEDVKMLCNQIGLETSTVNKKIRKKYYYFRIKSKDGLLKIIDSLSAVCPLISLGYKEERLRHHFKTKKVPGLRTKKGADQRRKSILELIENEPRTANQLSVELIIPCRSVKRHLKYLMKKNIIKRKKAKHNNYIYFFPN